MSGSDDTIDNETTEETVPPAAAHDENEGAAPISNQRVPIIPGPIIPFDNNQASLTSYPRGCPVLHVNVTVMPPVITIGVVHSVSFNVASKELLFHVSAQNRMNAGDHILASEAQLQLAPLCKVEAEVNDGTGLTKKSATVLTSYQPTANSPALYSLREDGPSGSLFHGIPRESLRYQQIDSVAEPVGVVTGLLRNQPAPQARSAILLPAARRYLLKMSPQLHIQPYLELDRDLLFLVLV